MADDSYLVTTHLPPHEEIDEDGRAAARWLDDVEQTHQAEGRAVSLTL